MVCLSLLVLYEERLTLAIQATTATSSCSSRLCARRSPILSRFSTLSARACRPKIRHDPRWLARPLLLNCYAPSLPPSRRRTRKPAVNPFTTGRFSTPTQKMSSEERFAASNCSTSMSGGPATLSFGQPSPMARPTSQGGPGHSSSGRTQSQWGGKRDKERPGAARSCPGSSFGPSSSLTSQQNLEPVAPLELSANRWTPASLTTKGLPAETESPEVVDRKVRALLNKLTMERFDSISDQIIAWANRSEKEKNGRMLIQVIRLVFKEAADEATWSEMYARLCRKMMEQISPNVRDDGIKNAEGKPIAGEQLFRKYLLNRC